MTQGACSRCKAPGLTSALWAGIVLTVFQGPVHAEKLAWYEHPGRWFKSVMFGVVKDDQAPVELGINAAGGKVGLSEYPDQLVLVTFWASWCGVCKSELPGIAAMNESFAGRKYAHVAVNVMDGFDDFKSFAAAGRPRLDYLFDKDGSVASRYAVSAIPHSVLINTATGKVVGAWKGGNKVEEMRKSVDEALARSFM